MILYSLGLVINYKIIGSLCLSDTTIEISEGSKITELEFRNALKLNFHIGNYDGYRSGKSRSYGDENYLEIYQNRKIIKAIPFLLDSENNLNQLLLLLADWKAKKKNFMRN